MLVLAEEPRIDLIVRITGARGGDGARAFALRRDEAGRWMENDALGGAPHPAEVDLSDPDRHCGGDGSGVPLGRGAEAGIDVHRRRGERPR